MICFFGHNYPKIAVQIGTIGLCIYCFKDVMFSYWDNVVFVSLQYRKVPLVEGVLFLGRCVRESAVQTGTVWISHHP